MGETIKVWVIVSEASGEERVELYLSEEDARKDLQYDLVHPRIEKARILEGLLFVSEVREKLEGLG